MTDNNNQELLNSLHDLTNQLESGKTTKQDTLYLLEKVVNHHMDLSHGENLEDEEKTFVTNLQCITKLGVSVMAMTPEEALDKINGGYYDIDNSLDINDLEFNHKAITFEDIDEL